MKNNYLLLRLQHLNNELSRLSDDELGILAKIIEWVVKDNGDEDNAYEILSAAFENIDIENMQILLFKAQEALNDGSIDIIIPNLISFLFATKKGYKDMQDTGIFTP